MKEKGEATRQNIQKEVTMSPYFEWQKTNEVDYSDTVL